MKREECMESEFSGVFLCKTGGQNLVLRSPGTQSRAASAVWCLFLKKHTNVVNQTARF